MLVHDACHSARSLQPATGAGFLREGAPVNVHYHDNDNNADANGGSTAVSSAISVKWHWHLANESEPNWH